MLTAISNDYNFNRVFSRQVESCVSPGDVVIGISTSGNSVNVLEGLRAARRRGAVVIGFSGGTGGKLKHLCHLCLCVPSANTARIQEGHITVGHILCAAIEDALFRWVGRLLAAGELADLCRKLRRQGKRVVFTNGCFDILHAGHIQLLTRARQLGDVLVVGLNSDASVKRLKGKGRPIFSQSERAGILASLVCVDYVTSFSEDTPAHLIEKILPDVLIKGADYQKGEIVGARAVLARGGRVVRVPLISGKSTTAILKKIHDL